MIDKDLFNQVEQKEETINFATIAGIFEDGVTLRFDGEAEPTQKHYKVNSFAVFKVDDRVRIIKDSGTYVVEYAIGSPKTSFNADTSTDSLKLNGKTETNLNVASSKNFTEKHTGNAIGFFNSGWCSRWSVPKAPTNATLAQTVAKLNDLINTLQSYGLIGR